jgi:DNA-binding transcriptional LysR family regulator
VPRPDLNLLVTLDVLLAEGNVARAARRLKLSASAMSRALARLRQTTGDPLLVRAGRGLVPTPRALELRERVAQLVEESEAVLRPAIRPDLRKLVRTFTIRSSEGFAETFGPALIARVSDEAPGVRLRFLQKVERDSRALRDGSVDLETGVIDDATGPEIRAQALFRDRFVGVMRMDHPLSEREITVARYAKCKHVLVSRRGQDHGVVDDALNALGLKRSIVAVVSGFSVALSFTRALDVIATVPERHTAALRFGLRTFPLPLQIPEVTVSLSWHPRMHADPAHKWLRECVRDICRAE